MVSLVEKQALLFVLGLRLLVPSPTMADIFAFTVILFTAFKLTQATYSVLRRAVSYVNDYINAAYF